MASPGDVRAESNLRLYTPAMLAELLHVPVSIIRRWHRRRLIVPVREVRRLPYFDFQEVATARQLAELLAAGASPDAMERKLEELARYVPDVDRPLAQLSVIVQGQQLLLRQGEGLIEPGGQLRIDFDALDRQHEDSRTPNRPASRRCPLPGDNLRQTDPALLRERPPSMKTTASWKRPPTCIERHWRPAVRMQKSAFSWPNSFIEWATSTELASDITWPSNWMRIMWRPARIWDACWQKPASWNWPSRLFREHCCYHSDYPDVHYHLARTLDDLGERGEAEHHWREFLLAGSQQPLVGRSPQPTES